VLKEKNVFKINFYAWDLMGLYFRVLRWFISFTTKSSTFHRKWYSN